MIKNIYIYMLSPGKTHHYLLNIYIIIVNHIFNRDSRVFFHWISLGFIQGYMDL